MKFLGHAFVRGCRSTTWKLQAKQHLGFDGVGAQCKTWSSLQKPLDPRFSGRARKGLDRLLEGLSSSKTFPAYGLDRVDNNLPMV